MDKSEIKFNICFWGAYFIYEWLGNASVGSEYTRYFINAMVIVPLTCITSLFTVHYLVRHYYLREHKTMFWILFVLSAIIFTLVRRTFNYYYTYPLYFPEGLNTMSFLYGPKLLIEAVNTYLIVGLYALFYFIREYYNQQRISDELRQDKVETELKLLKSQVQPHFIFNTLNNIYSFAKTGHPKAPDLIYRLSGFLSYNLYDSNKEYVPLTQELDYIRHYIELERIRYGDTLDVSMNEFDPLEGYYVSPLLFLPFVENAFKHGPSLKVEDSWIRIDLSAKEDWLTFKIENSIPNGHGQNNSKIGGIGIENSIRRLEILYPGRHILQCKKDNDSYLVILRLKPTYYGNQVLDSGR